LSEGGELSCIDGTRLVKNQGDVHLYVATLLRAVEGQVIVEGGSAKGSHIAKGESSSLFVGGIKHVLDLACKVAVHPDKGYPTIDWTVFGVLGASAGANLFGSLRLVIGFVPELGHWDVVGLEVTSGTAEKVSQTRSIENNFDHRLSSKVVLNLLSLTRVVVPYFSEEGSPNDRRINLYKVGRELLLSLAIRQTKTTK